MGKVDGKRMDGDHGPMTGHDVMEHALDLRARFGVEHAAAWMARQGLNYELAIFALVGGKRAPKYVPSPAFEKKAS